MSDQIQPWPLLKQGSQGHPVPALQYLLRDRGHHMTVDGIFGPKTEAAVEQFQIAGRSESPSTGSSAPSPGGPWSAGCSRSDPAPGGRIQVRWAAGAPSGPGRGRLR
jgi:peptidoglycan hydrolase-like protein with peptidoglycan-binding domain